MAKRAEETSNLESDDGKVKQRRKPPSKHHSGCEDGDGTVLRCLYIMLVMLWLNTAVDGSELMVVADSEIKVISFTEIANIHV
jgi:hypothetical protein